VLDDLAANKINIRLIVEHWDDVLRLAGSLKLESCAQPASPVPLSTVQM
jgi:TnpA family transposase